MLLGLLLGKVVRRLAALSVGIHTTTSAASAPTAHRMVVHLRILLLQLTCPRSLSLRGRQLGLLCLLQIALLDKGRHQGGIGLQHGEHVLLRLWIGVVLQGGQQLLQGHIVSGIRHAARAVSACLIHVWQLKF